MNSDYSRRTRMKRIRLSFSVLIALLAMLTVISCGGGGGGGGGGSVGNGSSGNNSGTENNSSTGGNSSTTQNQEVNDYIYIASQDLYMNNANYGGADVVRPAIMIFDGKATANTIGKVYIVTGLTSKIDGVSPAEIISDCQNHVTAITSTSRELGTCNFAITPTFSAWTSHPYIFIAGNGAQKNEGFYIINPSENSEQTWTAIREDGILYLFAEPGLSNALNLQLSADDYMTYRQSLVSRESVFADSLSHLMPEERWKFLNLALRFEISSSQKLKLNWFLDYGLVGGGVYTPAQCWNFEQMKASILFRESNPFGDKISFVNVPEDALYLEIEGNFPSEDLSKLADLLKTYSRDVFLVITGNSNVLTIPTNTFRDCSCIKNVLYWAGTVTIEANAFPDATIIQSHG